MYTPLVLLAAVQHGCRTAAKALLDLGRLGLQALRSRRGLAAENLFPLKQLALLQERKVRPRRADDSTRWMMATLSRMFLWRDALVCVQHQYAHPLAAQRIPAVLALEVQAAREIPPAPGPALVGPKDGRREPELGRGAHRQ